MKRMVALFIMSWMFMLTGGLASAEVRPTIVSITPEIIARGDVITIVGNNLSRNGVKTTVRIDDQPVPFVEVESGKKITARVDTMPEPETRRSAGEYERSVVVGLGEKNSPPVTFYQLTWGVVLKARVLLSFIVYIALACWILFSTKATIFRSKTGQFSLSKIQMGVWTFVFGLFYVVLSATWLEFLDITEGMFWLMGISSATAVGAKAIVVKNAVEKPPHPSKLFHDWNEYTNQYEVSLHRVQIAVWSLIVLTIFTIKVISTMKLAEVPGNLLTLMGISGGTYLGFNYPKAKKAAANSSSS